MARIFDYLWLPKETTPVELAYVRRVNRIALWVCWLHVPLFVCVALACGTSVLQALLIGTFLAAGPTIADRALANPRHLGLVVGSTAMGLGALLVHLGQGPVQIEMHFHFFAALALLTVFGNPLVVWVAAATVALHHALFWAFWPRSVFNYDAQIWVVAVHAAFVVVESVAAAFIARNFYDNVIGLDRIVRERTRTIREILDNVTFGMFVTDASLRIRQGHSRSCAAFLPARDGDLAGTPLTSALGLSSRDAEAFVGLYDQIFEAEGLEDFALSQLPTRFKVGARTLGLTGSIIRSEAGSVAAVMFCVSDVSALVEAERNAAHAHSLLKIVGEKSRFRAFVEEARGVFERIREALVNDPAGSQTGARTALHTMKGAFGVYGLADLVALTHAVEEKCPLANEDVAGVEDALRRLLDLHLEVLGVRYGETAGQAAIEISRVDLESLRQTLREGIPEGPARARVESLLTEFTCPTVSEMAGPLADHCRQLAGRFGKRAAFRLEGAECRLPESFRPFMATLTHLLRNAVDHGIESPSRRGSKPAVASISLTVLRSAGGYEFRFADDGAGLDFETIRERAVAMGLVGADRAPGLGADELSSFIFHPRFSTASNVTDISGRGLGMTAVRDAVERLDGILVIESERGRGMTVIVRLPAFAPALRAAA